MTQEYTKGKCIGKGSFGDVYSGMVKSTGEKIAIKRIQKKVLYQYGDYLINAFWKEIDCMKKCECENSVKLIKNFETSQNFNIIMELCDSDLSIYLNKKPEPFSVNEIREIFQQLNTVFKLMNKNNIIHRDLKLGNILIKYTDKNNLKFIPKLSDYGFSKDLNTCDYTKTHLGTPATMAPEIMMEQKYNEQCDLWSIGIMMYQLHFKELPYIGFNEKEILYKIQNNTLIKQPKDPKFRDLLNKLLVMDPLKRISWNDYYKHPFFDDVENLNINKEVKMKNNKRYIKISDFNVGFNCNKELYDCYIAKDTKNKDKKVLIKSFKDDFIISDKNNNNELFSEEISLFKAFNGNENILKLINIDKEEKRINLIFEYNHCEILSNYAKKNPFSEKDIKKLNKSLYDIFIFNECNYLPFIFISLYSFGINKDGNPIIFDFGLHKLFLDEEEIKSYYLSNEQEINNYNKNRIKTNVMNYGITLLKLFCGNNLSIKNKEIILPPNIVLSDIFNNFISKCLYRDIKKRYTWLQLGDNEFILENTVGFSNIIGNKPLIDNDKLEIIFDSLINKFDFIIKYYDKLNIKKNKEYIIQIESFLFVTLFEMRVIYQFFNRNIYERPFTNQHEISFIAIDDDCIIKKFSLNFVNPLLKDTKIINMNNNKLIIDFLPKLKKDIQKMEKISNKIHSQSKDSIINGDFNKFLQNLLQNFENSKIQEYFFSIVKKAENEKKKDDMYKELCLGEYLCEFILFIKTCLYENEQIYFNKQNFIKDFLQIFGEEKNKIEISVIRLKETKKNYVLISFLGILFKCYKSNTINKQKWKNNRNSIDGLVRYYPMLMKKIVELQNSK